MIEAGWAESGRHLREDARLWLWATEPLVQFVFVVEHVETKVLRDNRLEEERKNKKFDRQKIEETLSSGKPIKLRESPADGNELQQAWTELLLQLHREDKLMKPLLGSVQSKLYIYRRKRDDDDDDDTAIVRTGHEPISQDIYCHFETEIYPNNPKKETKLQWKDILGGNIPEAFAAKDLQKYFYVNLQQYHESVKESIEEQIMGKATRRAVAILERRNAIPCYPHTQSRNEDLDQIC